MMQWLQRVFGPAGSSSTAKERLRLVLLTDHLSLAPEVIEALKRDLIGVISRYVEVDESHCDVSFERQDSAVAMLANIPIVAMRDRPRPTPPDGGPGNGRREPAVAESEAIAPAAEPLDPARTTAAALPAESAPAAETAPAGPRRRRRRRRAATTSGDERPASATG